MAAFIEELLEIQLCLKKVDISLADELNCLMEALRLKIKDHECASAMEAQSLYTCRADASRNLSDLRTALEGESNSNDKLRDSDEIERAEKDRAKSSEESSIDEDEEEFKVDLSSEDKAKVLAFNIFDHKEICSGIITILLDYLQKSSKKISPALLVLHEMIVRNVLTSEQLEKFVKIFKGLKKHDKSIQLKLIQSSFYIIEHNHTNLFLDIFKSILSGIKDQTVQYKVFLTQLVSIFFENNTRFCNSEIGISKFINISKELLDYIFIEIDKKHNTLYLLDVIETIADFNIPTTHERLILSSLSERFLKKENNNPELTKKFYQILSVFINHEQKTKRPVSGLNELLVSLKGQIDQKKEGIKEFLLLVKNHIFTKLQVFEILTGLLKVDFNCMNVLEAATDMFIMLKPEQQAEIAENERKPNNTEKKNQEDSECKEFDYKFKCDVFNSLIILFFERVMKKNGKVTLENKEKMPKILIKNLLNVKNKSFFDCYLNILMEHFLYELVSSVEIYKCRTPEPKGEGESEKNIFSINTQARQESEAEPGDCMGSVMVMHSGDESPLSVEFQEASIDWFKLSKRLIDVFVLDPKSVVSLDVLNTFFRNLQHLSDECFSKTLSAFSEHAEAFELFFTFQNSRICTNQMFIQTLLSTRNRRALSVNVLASIIRLCTIQCLNKCNFLGYVLSPFALCNEYSKSTMHINREEAMHRVLSSSLSTDLEPAPDKHEEQNALEVLHLLIITHRTEISDFDRILNFLEHLEYSPSYFDLLSVITSLDIHTHFKPAQLYRFLTLTHKLVVHAIDTIVQKRALHLFLEIIESEDQNTHKEEQTAVEKVLILSILKTKSIEFIEPLAARVLKDTKYSDEITLLEIFNHLVKANEQRKINKEKKNEDISKKLRTFLFLASKFNRFFENYSTTGYFLIQRYFELMQSILCEDVTSECTQRVKQEVVVEDVPQGKLEDLPQGKLEYKPQQVVDVPHNTTNHQVLPHLIDDTKDPSSTFLKQKEKHSEFFLFEELSAHSTTEEEDSLRDRHDDSLRDSPSTAPNTHTQSSTHPDISTHKPFTADEPSPPLVHTFFFSNILDLTITLLSSPSLSLSTLFPLYLHLLSTIPLSNTLPLLKLLPSLNLSHSDLQDKDLRFLQRFASLSPEHNTILHSFIDKLLHLDMDIPAIKLFFLFVEQGWKLNAHPSLFKTKESTLLTKKITLAYISTSITHLDALSAITMLPPEPNTHSNLILTLLKNKEQMKTVPEPTLYSLLHHIKKFTTPNVPIAKELLHLLSRNDSTKQLTLEILLSTPNYNTIVLPYCKKTLTSYNKEIKIYRELYPKNKKEEVNLILSKIKHKEKTFLIQMKEELLDCLKSNDQYVISSIETILRKILQGVEQ